MCHRCLKQEAKFKSGEIETISQYCPLDLFSGDSNRMKRAILDLYENPHNRFKIFKNGQMMYTEKIGNQADVDQQLSQFFDLPQNKPDGTGINLLASILCASVLGQSTLNSELVSMVPEKRRSKICNSKANALSKDCILSTLLTLQKSCGDVDDTKAEALSHKLLGEAKSTEELHNLSIWYPLITPNLASMSEKILEEQLGHSQKFIEELKQLQQFLLSVTAKDVSLLITFRTIEDSNLETTLQLPNLTLGPNQMMRVMISVIDLDPKAVHRIPTWIEKRLEWLNSYLQH